jgi:hypothetical protein
MVKKTNVPAGQPEVTTQRRGILRGSPRLDPGLSTTVLSTGEVLVASPSPGGTVTPGYVAVALGSQFRKS